MSDSISAESTSGCVTPLAPRASVAAPDHSTTALLHDEVPTAVARRRILFHTKPESASVPPEMVRKRLGALGPEIIAQRDAISVYQILDRQVHALLDAGLFVIYLLETNNFHLRLAFASDTGMRLPAISLGLQDPASHVARSARERCEVMIDWIDTIDDVPATADTAVAMSRMIVPLILGHRLIGVMAVETAEPYAYGAQERLIFRTMGAYTAVALNNTENARLSQKNIIKLPATERLRRERSDDHDKQASSIRRLSSLPIRHFLADQLETEVDLCLHRYDQWLTNKTGTAPVESDLIFFKVDLDHFNEIRDTHGHAAMSVVLEQLRSLLKHVCRESDYLIQWRGTEFLVVARATQRKNAEPVAERIRATIAHHDFLLNDGTRISRTCSIGFACFPYLPRYPRLLTWTQVINVADHGLQLAKESGRNAWTGLYGTDQATPDAVFQGILRNASDSPDASIRLLSSSKTV